jgi:peroxiredoxin
MEETRQLEQLWRKYKDQGLVVLGIFSYEAEPDVIKYLAPLGVTYPNGSDPKFAIQSQYEVTGSPETVILARDGALVFHQAGPQKSGKIDLVLAPLLSK